MNIYINCSAVSTTPSKNLSPVSILRLVTGKEPKSLKLFAGVNDNAEKLFTGVNDTADKLLTPAIKESCLY
jgi:hypothetical protein